jgi:hypothetical protein
MKSRGRFDELITVLFMLLAVGAVICFFVLGRDNPTYLILGGLAILIRIAQYAKRFF